MGKMICNFVVWANTDGFRTVPPTKIPPARIGSTPGIVFRHFPNVGRTLGTPAQTDSIKNRLIWTCEFSNPWDTHLYSLTYLRITFSAIFQVPHLHYRFYFILISFLLSECHIHKLDILFPLFEQRCKGLLNNRITSLGQKGEACKMYFLCYHFTAYEWDLSSMTCS